MRMMLRGISWDWSCIGPWSYLCDEWDVTTLHDPYMHERLRLGFERDSQLNEMRAHELTMIMRWGWVELDEVMILDCMSSLHLLPSSPISIFSLVLPCSCSFREREGGEKWENGLSWCCFSWGMVHPISCIWHVGSRVELRTTHSPLTACSSDTGGWSDVL